MNDRVMDARRSRHRSGRERGWQTIWRRYRFEIIWALVVAVGLFLILEDMNIRATLLRWLRDAAMALFRGSAQLSERVGQTIQRLTASDLLGYLLVIRFWSGACWRFSTARRSPLRCPQVWRQHSSQAPQHRRPAHQYRSVGAPPVRQQRMPLAWLRA